MKKFIAVLMGTFKSKFLLTSLAKALGLGDTVKILIDSLGDGDITGSEIWSIATEAADDIGTKYFGLPDEIRESQRQVFQWWGAKFFDVDSTIA